MSTSLGPTSAPGALLPGRWFDGRSSQARPVLVGLQPTPRGPSLLLHPLAPHGEAPTVLTNAQVGWPETWSAQRPPPRLVVDLREHGSLEVDAVGEWQAALAAAGARPGLAQHMQTRWSVLLAVLLAATIGLLLFYRYGTPWAATQLTRWVPMGWETAMADQGQQQMDDGLLKPSKLAPERQTQLRARFDALAQHIPPALQRYPGYTPQWALEFRVGMGANAFALPGGRVVVTDGLVQAAARQGLADDALVGVLAHEIGHVVHRHTTRMVVEQGVLQMGLGLALGDVSAILSTGSALLTGLHYRRSHEREADCFAIGLMRHAALPTAPMGTLLLAIAQDEEEEEKAKGKTPSASQPAPRKQGKAEAAHPVWSLLSSHPDTVERARALQQGQAAHCPQEVQK